MLNCAEQVQIQKYETHTYKTLKTVGVQVIVLKHPAKHKRNVVIFSIVLTYSHVLRPMF